ncbi:putative Ni/Fe-hydrogenase B-type cytochrome subunit [bacterium BMS3Abin07]|nr:putative Ni/Fe-hydrogenase B-type cytochrome subunit [bacterium BMS3Abin07]GBE31644.1 putative Ni/Fe-hydrogenase B-type cytochrome subunit [bacterium BMS3Bbin05]HDO22020.1 Ni/Fe-hydrogenase, b-type cytochrome subunit [Nitrospirota bacterium]HDZ88389.1 Ni/Fe-hydrogenase, b-type cytochrome subunit [Nitrospirota bacterium]
MDDRKRVYAWEFPVRLTHWINVLCIILLSVTGFYIGNPFIHGVSSTGYIMGWMRFIHFVSAYTFLMSMIIRLYWAFMGNRYASWKVWFPFTKKQRTDFMDAVKFYLFIGKKPPYAVGHTALAGLTYLIVFFLFIFQIISGFALYSVAQHGALWTVMGGWLTGVMYLQTIRLLHHLAMYLILAFVIVHVYLGWYLDVREKNGLMGSIFGGYKFVSGKEWE